MFKVGTMPKKPSTPRDKVGVLDTREREGLMEPYVITTDIVLSQATTDPN
jgi:hypothetical protein